MADVGSRRILILIMSHYLTVSAADLFRGIVGVSIRAWASTLDQLGFPSFMVGDLGIFRNGSGCHT